MSTILQDPQTSLNPVFSIDNPIGNLLTEALAMAMARQDSSQGILSRGAEALRHVNLAAPERRLSARIRIA